MFTSDAYPLHQMCGNIYVWMVFCMCFGIIFTFLLDIKSMNFQIKWSVIYVSLIFTTLSTHTHICRSILYPDVYGCNIYGKDRGGDGWLLIEWRIILKWFWIIFPPKSPTTDTHRQTCSTIKTKSIVSVCGTERHREAAQYYIYMNKASECGWGIKIAYPFIRFSVLFVQFFNWILKHSTLIYIYGTDSTTIPAIEIKKRLFIYSKYTEKLLLLFCVFFLYFFYWKRKFN